MSAAGGRPPVLLLVTLTVGGVMAINIYIPSMPDIARALTTSESAVQQTVTVFLITFAAAQLVYGPLSDRYGRRYVLLGGLCIFIAANLLCAAAVSIDFLLGARILQAAGAACGSVLTRAIVRDSYGIKGAVRIMGYLAMSAGIAAAVAPTIGGALQTAFGWRSGFLFLAAVAAVPVFAAIFVLRETHTEREAQGGGIGVILRNYGKLWRSQQFLGYALSVAFVNGAFFAFITASPFILMERIGLTPDVFGVMMLFSTGGFLIGTWTGPRVAAQIGLHATIAIGAVSTTLFIAAMTGVALAGIVTVSAVMVPMFLIGISAGFIFPPSSAAAVGLMPQIAGTASAALGFLQLGMGAIGSGLASVLVHDTQLPVAILMLVMSLGGLGALVLIRRGGGTPEQAPGQVQS